MIFTYLYQHRWPIFLSHTHTVDSLFPHSRVLDPTKEQCSWDLGCSKTYYIARLGQTGTGSWKQRFWLYVIMTVQHLRK